MFKLKLLAVVGILSFVSGVFAMPGPGGGGPPGPPGGGGPPCWAPPCIPIDNGIVFLLIAACLLGVYQLSKRRSRSSQQ